MAKISKKEQVEIGKLTKEIKENKLIGDEMIESAFNKLNELNQKLEATGGKRLTMFDIMCMDIDVEV